MLDAQGTRSPGRGPDPLLWAGGDPAQRAGQRLGQGKRSPSNNPIYKELPNGLGILALARDTVSIQLGVNNI